MSANGATVATLQRAGSIKFGTCIRLLPGALGWGHFSLACGSKKFTCAEQVRVANGQNEGEQLQRPVSTCVGPMRRRAPLFSSTLLGLHPLGNPAQVGVAY